MPAPALVLHIPHASPAIPMDVRETLLLGARALAVELLRVTDAFTDELFEVPPSQGCSIVYPVSRLVVDPERFRDDLEEVMAERGVGAVYTCASDGRPLRNPLSPQRREALLATWYDPHHASLTAAVRRALEAHDRCLIIDCHSFPSTPLYTDLDQRVPRPAMCIGTDVFHTPHELAVTALQHLEAQGLSVQVDRPYAGTLVPREFYRRDGRVHSIMIEVNRSWYMDEATGQKSPRFAEMRQMIQGLIGRLAGR